MTENVLTISVIIFLFRFGHFKLISVYLADKIAVKHNCGVIYNAVAFGNGVVKLYSAFG
jgi:hypothetical protein